MQKISDKGDSLFFGANAAQVPFVLHGTQQFRKARAGLKAECKQISSQKKRLCGFAVETVAQYNLRHGLTRGIRRRFNTRNGAAAMIRFRRQHKHAPGNGRDTFDKPPDGIGVIRIIQIPAFTRPKEFAGSKVLFGDHDRGMFRVFRECPAREKVFGLFRPGLRMTRCAYSPVHYARGLGLSQIMAQGTKHYL